MADRLVRVRTVEVQFRFRFRFGPMVVGSGGWPLLKNWFKPELNLNLNEIISYNLP